jgi:hypothetical protein
MSNGGIKKFLHSSRVKFTLTDKQVRNVSVSDVLHTFEQGIETESVTLGEYVANKAPLFYRDVTAIAESLEEDGFLTAIKDTLKKLPKEPSFQQSHFAEIFAAIFAEEVLGLKRVYSKLALLTAENSNAYKIDLLMYRPNTDPVEFVLGEVKSSHKCEADGLPAKHHQSCFAELFNSAREYANDDYEFDLAAAKDRLGSLKDPDRFKVREALKPLGSKIVRFMGLVVIDLGTKSDEEIPVLATRKSKREFDVDLICIEKINETTSTMFDILEGLKKHVHRRGN